MKIKEIASEFRLDQESFEQWLVQHSGIPHKSGMFSGILIEDDCNIQAAVSGFRAYAEDYNHKEAQKKAEKDRAHQESAQAAQLKQQAMASMLITSGFSFDGYRITKYSGYISGDDVVQIDRGRDGIFSKPTDVGESLMSSLSVIRRKALAELKEAAYHLGCNAVIGVDFDYLTLDPETVNAGGGTLYMPYVFGVTANGNAVIIEKS
jgi:uncharacterized protein YbjQ (UPF0145 family)